MLDREPLLVGVSVSSMENAFRVVDIGPNAENKEVFAFSLLDFFFFWGVGDFMAVLMFVDITHDLH